MAQRGDDRGAERRARAQALFDSAELKASAGEVQGAIDDYSAAIQLDHTWPRPRVARGSIYVSQGRLDEAMNDFTEAIRRDPSYARAYAKRGLIYLGRRDYAAAENDFTKALEAAPRHPTLLAKRIEARIGANKGWPALDDANTFVEAHPEATVGYYLRGLALEKVGDAAGAEENLREAERRGSSEARRVLFDRYGGV